MSAVLKTYLELSLEMRDALSLLALPGAEGYSSWQCSAITFGLNTRTSRRSTLDALARRDLVLKWKADSGSLRYAITKLGRNVIQEG